MIVGVVGDIHLPFEHPHYLEFCLDMFAQWRVNRIHLVGDVVDQHALGFWESDPAGMSAEDEAREAEEKLKPWRKKIKTATVCIGNHDARHYRTARRAGIPDRYLRDYSTVWGTPGWQWRESHVIDGVLYEHGIGTSGKDAAMNRAIKKRRSVVIGHVHTFAGVKYHANDFNRIFGMNAGCGIDCGRYAFEYAKPFAERPVLGCGIVIDGRHAYFEPMPITAGEEYHREAA